MRLEVDKTQKSSSSSSSFCYHLFFLQIFERLLQFFESGCKKNNEAKLLDRHVFGIFNFKSGCIFGLRTGPEQTDKQTRLVIGRTKGYIYREKQIHNLCKNESGSEKSRFYSIFVTLRMRTGKMRLTFCLGASEQILLSGAL
jgi:hypothetical protein